MRAIGRFPEELWHDDFTLPVAARQLLHDKIDTKILTFNNEYNTFGGMSGPA